MKKNSLLLFIIFIYLTNIVFAATKTTVKKPITNIKNSSSSGEQWVLNTSFDGLGLGGEYIIKKSDVMYGGGVYFSYDEENRYYNHYYWNGYYGDYWRDTNIFKVGAYGIIGKPFKGTNFTGQFKLGLVSSSYSNSNLNYSENRLDSLWGLGLGYRINKDYDFYFEANSDRGLVLGVGFKM